MITNTTARILRQWIEDASLGVPGDGSTDWSTYEDIVPDKPQKMISILGTAGIKDGRIMVSGDSKFHLGWQIQVRADSSSNAYAKCHAIARAMDLIKRDEITIDDVTYRIHSVTRTTNEIPLGREDTTERFIYSLNGTISVTEISTGTGS